MNYKILESSLKIKNQNLLVHLKISLPDQERVRLIAVFQSGVDDRRIFCNSKIEGTVLTSNHMISLPFVFFNKKVSAPVQLHFEIESSTVRSCLDTAFLYDSTNFIKQEVSRSRLQTVGNKLAFAGCTLLLPCFLFSAFLASRGYGTLDTGENTIKTGKKAIFLHANTKVKKICGYSYSPRECKTAYLKRCYESAAAAPVNENQVLFLSERKLERHSNLDLLYHSLKKDSKIAAELYVSTVTIDRLSLFEIRKIAEKMAKSRLIILEDFYPQLHALTLRKETKLIQLWHACGAFKTFGFSHTGKPGGPGQASKNHRSYDYCFASSEFLAPIYAEAFGISTSRVKPLGVPRTDFLFNEVYKNTTRERLYQHYPVLRGKKVILFAPTFRGYGNKDAYYPLERFDVNRYMEALPQNCILLIKQHPFVKQRFLVDKKWKNSVIDFSERGENINDLLLVSDLLITDYSSVIFEASLLDIPMLFYVFDKEEYLEKRDIYFDFDAFIPGTAVKTEAQLSYLSSGLLELQKAAHKNKNVNFKEKYLGALDGQSTERICRFLKTLL